MRPIAGDRGSAPVAGLAVVGMAILAGLATVAGLISWAYAPARPAAARAVARPAQVSRSLPGRPAAGSSSPEHRIVRHPGTRPASSSPTRPPPTRPAGSGPVQGSRATSAAVFTRGLRVGVAGDTLTSFDAGVSRASAAVSYVPWGTPVRWLARLIRIEAWHHAEAIYELYPGRSAWDAAQVASGSGDAWLRSLGHAIAGDHRHIVVSFFPEMNGPWRAAWSHGAANYVRAFRHVHAVLTPLAGWLITWSWQPSAMHNANPNPMPWWPGSRYVNVIALDGYYYFQHDTFGAIFAATIRLIRRAEPGHPIMIGETAAGPMYNRQAWEINNLFAGVRRYHLLGFVWFNHAQHRAPYNFHQDWRLEDHPGALAAFRACLARYGPVARFLR